MSGIAASVSLSSFSTHIRERIHAFQVEPAGNTSEELARMISSDITRWTAVAKASKIKPAN